MAREILERDLDLNGLACFNPRVATLPNDVVCLRDMPTFTDGLTQDISKVVHGDYITGKAGGQVWLGGTAANDNLTIKATSNGAPTGTLGLVAAHTTWTVDQTVLSAIGATLDAIKIIAPTIQLSGSTNIATAAGFNLVSLPVATYNAVSPITVTNAATLSIAGPPTYTGNAFIANRYAMWVQSGGVRISGRDDSRRAIWLDQSAEQDIAKTGGPLAIGTTDSNDLSLFAGNVTLYLLKTTGTSVYSNTASFSVTPGNGVVYRLNASVPSATNAVLDTILYDTTTVSITSSTPITTAAGFNQVTFKAPIYNGTPTVSRGATVAIEGPPTGSATVTNRYALDVQSGTTNLAGTVVIQALTGLLKATSGVVGVGTGGTDYEFPLTFSQGLTRAVNAVTGDYITGKTGNQTWTGSTDAAGTLNIRSSSNAAPGALTLTGGPIRFSAGGITVTAASGATLDAISVPATNVTISGGTAITTSNGLNFVSINAPTYTGTAAITNAGTFVVNGGPINGGSTTIANSFALWVQGTNGNSLFGARVWMGSIVSAVAANQFYSQLSQSVTYATSATLDSSLWDSATTTLVGTPTAITTANGFNQNVFKAPVINGAATITNSATVAISGAPTGTATITNPFAFWVQTGTTKLGGTTVIQALTGMLKGTSGTVSVAVAGTDYQAALTPADSTISFPTGSTIKVNQLSNKFIVQGTADAMLTGAQFLGSLGSGIVKNTTTTGVLSIATAGTDFESPLIFSTGLTRAVNTITVDLSTGKAGGLTATGGTAASESLTLQSTTNGAKGRILNGSWFALDEVNSRVLIGTQTAGAGAPLTIASRDASVRAIHLSFSGEQDISKDNGLLAVGTATSHDVEIFSSNTGRYYLTSSGNAVLTNRSPLGVTTNSLRIAFDDSVAQAPGAVLDAVLFDAATATVSGTGSITTPLGFNQNTFKAPTYTSGSAVTVVNAATVAISGPPNTSGSLSITNPSVLWLQNGRLTISGADGATNAIYLDRTSNQSISKTGGGYLAITVLDNNFLYFDTNNTARVQIGGTGNVVLSNNNTFTSTAGNGVVFRYDQAVTAGTSVTLDNYLFDSSTITMSGTTAITTATGFNFATFKAPGITGSATTISKAATVAISGAPNPSGSVSITNPYALWVQGGAVAISGVDASVRAIIFDRSGEQDVSKTGGLLNIGTADNNNLGLFTGNTQRILINGSGQAIFFNRGSPGSLTSGNAMVHRYDSALSQSASSTLDTILFDTGTVTLTGGATSITTALGFNYITIKRPIYSNVSVMNITNAATVAIAGPPIPAGNIDVENILNGYSLWSQQGVVRSDGPVTIGSSGLGKQMLTVACNSGYDQIGLYPMGSPITDGVDRDFLFVSQQGASVLDGLTVGRWAGVSLFAPSFTHPGGGTAPSVTEATNLRIFGEPTFSGSFTIGSRYAMHLSGGVARFDGGSASVPNDVIFEVKSATLPGSIGSFKYFKVRVTGDTNDYYVALGLVGS